MLNECSLDTFHENEISYSLNNSRPEVDGVLITSQQLPWGLVIMQHRKCHSTEKQGIRFQGSHQTGSDFTQKDALLCP